MDPETQKTLLGHAFIAVCHGRDTPPTFFFWLSSLDRALMYLLCLYIMSCVITLHTHQFSGWTTGKVFFIQRYVISLASTCLRITYISILSSSSCDNSHSIIWPQYYLMPCPWRHGNHVMVFSGCPGDPESANTDIIVNRHQMTG